MDRNPDDRLDPQGSGHNTVNEGGSLSGGAAGAYNTGAAGSGANAPLNSGTGATGPAADLGGGAGYGSSGFGNSGGTSGASGYGNQPGGLGGTTGGMGGGMHGIGGSMGTEGGAGRRDPRERLHEARERLGQAGQQARDWKQRTERGLADRLEQGANRLRSRAQGAGAGYGDPAYAAGGAAGTSNVASDRAHAMEQNLADGMASAADWLRNGDLKQSVENQARNNPGRTLLIALGVGYLLGKAIRRR